MARRLLAIAFLGWILRLLPCLWYDLDYDEGVYYSSAALWLRGVWPYRDTVLVHPPGLLYVLLPVAWLPPDWGWPLARLLMTLVGAANVYLMGRLAARAFGPRAGYLAALCYCIYPEAATSERRILLEPLLNTTVLLMLLSQRWKAAWWGGCALCVKLWGALWLFTSLPRLRGWAILGGLIGVLLWLPGLAADPHQFYIDVFWFQSHRPPHGLDSAGQRLWDIFDPRHLAITLLGLAGLRSQTRLPSAEAIGQRSLAVQMISSWVLLVCSFYLAPGHFFHYRTQLAIPECFWAGAAVELVWTRRRFLIVWLSVPFAFVLALCMRFDLDNIQRARTIRYYIPADQSVFAFDPTVLLRAGRLPDWRGPAPVICDSYGTMLIDAGAGRASVIAAMASPESRKRVNQRLALSRWLVVDDRAGEQVSMDWCHFHYRPKFGDLWVAR
ncbi:hypothetical protein JST97_32725 [bacterium]|nr:hypothetical protein [bacterium]